MSIIQNLQALGSEILNNRNMHDDGRWNATYQHIAAMLLNIKKTIVITFFLQIDIYIYLQDASHSAIPSLRLFHYYVRHDFIRGCVKDDSRIDVTKKSFWPVIYNLQQKDYFPLRLSPVQLALYAITSRQYVPHFSHVSSTGPHGMPVDKAASFFWKCFVTPTEVSRRDIYNVSDVWFAR